GVCLTLHRSTEATARGLFFRKWGQFPGKLALCWSILQKLNILRGNRKIGVALSHCHNENYQLRQWLGVGVTLPTWL
ncbi:MAG: hypothetical protein ACLQCB_17295, partial [Spirochaetia bacterium]